MVAIWLPFTVCGTGTLVIRLHSLHAALIVIGTAYVCMLVATLGRPGRMMELDGRHFVGTLSRTYRYQLVWLGLFIPAAIVIMIFARRF
jgi:hypothetical protein